MLSEWSMEPLLSHLGPTGQREMLRGKIRSGRSTVVNLEDRVRETLNALKIRVRGERLQYVKSQLEKNYQTLQEQLREVEKLSQLRGNRLHLASSTVTSSLDAAAGKMSDDNGDLFLRSRLALFRENSSRHHCTGATRCPQICSKLNPGDSDARKIVVVDTARLEAVSRIPSYTAWMFVDRNERMTKDQSIGRRKRISYESNGKETFFCFDDEEEAAIDDDEEKTKETQALSESEKFISRITILEHGSGRQVLETIADFVQASVVKVESLCQSLPKARFGNNYENYDWQPAASILSVSQSFRQRIHYRPGCHMQSNGNLQQDDERDLQKSIPKTSKANVNGNANVEPRSNKEEGEEEFEMPTTLALALDSFDTLFCRRCLIFNCALHDCVEEIVVGANEIQPPSRLLERDQVKPCSPGCRFLVPSSTVLSPRPPATTIATMLVCTSSEFQRSSHKSCTSETNNEGYCLGGGGGVRGYHRHHPLNERMRAGDGDADDNNDEQVLLDCDESIALDGSTVDEGLPNSHEKKKRLLTLQENSVKKLKKNAKKISADEVLTTFGEEEAIVPVIRRTMEDAESSSDSILYTHGHNILNVSPMLDGDVFTSFGSTNDGDDNITIIRGDQKDGTREGTSEHWFSANGNIIEVRLKGQAPAKPVNNRWNRLEQDLCEKGIQIFGKNSCLIAQNVLKGCKSCQEIYDYLREQDMATTAVTGDESSSTARFLCSKGNNFRSTEFLQHSGVHKGRVPRPPKFRFGRKKVAPKFAPGAIQKRIGRGDGSAGVLNTLYPHYTPCSCGSRAGCGKECPCALRDMHCEKYCGCFKVCKNRFRGCQCAKSMCDRRNCPCFAAGRECDPDVCKFCRIDCGHGRISSQECHNMRILQREKKRLLLAQSNVCTGWGVFTRHPLRKNDYIGEYTGELISHGEADRRGRIYDRETSFLFNLNDKLVVDAFRKGNKLKFANHSSRRANCYAKVLLVGGDHRVGIFAKDKIEAGEEILYDYQYEPEIAPLWATKPG